MTDNHYQAFLDEIKELLVDLEEALIELENDSGNSELLDRAFRDMHTIKGTSGMFDCEDVAEFTHDIESVYDLIRNGDIDLNKEIIDLTLAARDQIELMIFKDESADESDKEKRVEIISKFQGILSKAKPEEITETEAAEEITETKPVSTKKTYMIDFRPDENIYLTGNDPALLIEELESLGEILVVCKLKTIPEFNEINPDFNYADWKILISTDHQKNELIDVFMFVEDNCKLDINELVGFELPTDDELKKLLYDNIKRNFDLTSTEFQRILSDNTKAAKQIEKKSNKAKITASSSLRVSSEKLDELVNLVGELVIVQAGLNQLAERKHDHELKSIAEQIDRLSSELRDSTLNIRMLQIGSTFSKFTRLVRDLCNELGKDIELITEGGETELDKTVLEKLNDPMVHIIRNSLDHGIESPEERLAKGKNPKGQITITAGQSGGNVLISIKDDGKGLNKEAIREKAIKQGIIQADQKLTTTELNNLIFHAGFSTAQTISNVSGRGVGMDVVKTAIESLRGTIKIESQEGEGTTISLILPLTLAIIDGLLVNVGNEFFVIPLSIIEECIELDYETIESNHGRNIVNIRDEIVPYINLREKFAVTGERPEIEQIVVVKIENTRLGFVVDEVVGQHQTVIKKLGKAFENVDGVSGATILGNGTVALILDAVKVWKDQQAHEEKIYSEN